MAALVNPELEWASEETESAEEGCLSLPGVLVEVERPVHVRVRAQDEHGEPILIEASGLEARVIQHEMDHLDGVLILDRTSRDQRKQAMRALREALRRPRAPQRRAPRRVRTVYLGTSEFAAAVLERLADSAAPPALVVTRPDRPRGPRPEARAAAGRRAGARARARASSSPRSCTRRRSLRADRRRPSPRSLYVVRVRRADQGAAAARTTRCSTSTRRCCRAGAARRRSSGRSWPATRETGVSIMRADRGAGLRARSASPGAEPIRARRRLRHARARGCRTLGGDAARAGARRAPGRSVEQDEARVTYAHKIEAARPRARPDAPARGGRARACARCGRTSARALPLPDGSFLGVIARARSTARRARPPAACVRTDGDRLLLDCHGGALELTEIRPPGGRPMRAADWLRGRPDPALTDFRLDPALPERDARRAAAGSRASEWADGDAEWYAVRGAR